MPIFFQKLDEKLFFFINHDLANPIGDWLFPCFNHAAPFILPLLIILGWLVYSPSRPRWILVLTILLAVILSDSLVFNPLKHQISRPRPASVLKNVRALASGAGGGYAFPSSHTANAFVAAGILTLACRRRAWLFLGAASMIGISRIYVGVHYPSDVLGSAILGTCLGFFFFKASKTIVARLSIVPSTETSSSIPHPKPSSWIPLGILLIIQGARWGWLATTELDVPPSAAWLWCHSMTSSNTGFLASVGKIWFTLFGSSPISLWSLPWILQTLWILGMATWILKRGNSNILWIFLGVTLLIPITSQLSFLGSPAQIFEDSDWKSPNSIRSMIFYGLLGFPIWISSLFFLPRNIFSSASTLLGLFLGCFFPSLPWWIPALMSTGTLLALTDWMYNEWFITKRFQSGWARLLLLLICFYGIILGTAVYNPRFLRKLGISILPRNNPHYVQTGWQEWTKRIQPHLISSKTRELWTDSEISRAHIQYLLGDTWQVRCSGNSIPEIPLEGALYIREVYLSQIHPEVLFQGRSNQVFPRLQKQMRELDSTEIFRKGDPIRQFQLYQISKAP